MTPCHDGRRGRAGCCCRCRRSVAGFALTVALDLRTPASGPGVDLAPGNGSGYALNGLVLAGLATVILLRQVRQGFGWALAWLGVFWVLDGLSQSYVRAGMRVDEVWPAMTAVTWFLMRFTGFLPVSIAVLLTLFPDGRLLPGRWGTACRVALGVMVASILLVIVAPADGRLAGDADVPASVDLDPTTLAFVPPGVVGVAVLLSVVAYLVPMASVVVRYRASTGLERDRMRWLLWAVVAMALAVAVSLVFTGGRLQLVLLFLVMVLPAAAMTVAIVSPRIVPIEDLLARTIVTVGLGVVLLAVDAAAVALLTWVLDDDLGQAELVTLVLLLAVLLYGPVRQRLWTAVQRRMLGDRSNPYDVVAGLAVDAREVRRRAPSSSAPSPTRSRPRSASPTSAVEVDRSSGERVIATHGVAPSETRTLPITYRGREVGRVRAAGPRRRAAG